MAIGGGWEDAARSLQPQFPGSAPRAANPGIGGGNRPYAPGATQGHSFQPPLARQMAPRTDGPPPAQQNAAQSALPPGPQQPPGGMMGQPQQPPMDPMYAQRFASNLIDSLIRRAQMARMMRQQRGY